MATSYVSFDEGSTRKVRSWQRTVGSDTVEEWMYVLSESVFDTYTVTATAVAGSTANSHLLEIMAGATNRVGIKRIQVFQAAAANAAAAFAFDIIRLSSAGTGGTAKTPVALDPASAAAGATAMTLPSSKGTEGSTIGRYRGPISATVATVGLQPVLDLTFGDNNTKPLFISAGTSNGICIKNPAADSSVTLDIVVTFIDGFAWS